MEQAFRLNEKEYFSRRGVDVMAFSDVYPAGHQSGVTVIMHGMRLAANGDVRFEQTPGQWQPVPKVIERRVIPEKNAVVTRLAYPDLSGHLRGFNPMIYPDFAFGYTVTVCGAGESVEVTVDLDREIDERYKGKLCFNMELYPGELFGRGYLMDGQSGVFPRQPNGPTQSQVSNFTISGRVEPLPGSDAWQDRLADTSRGYNPIVADDLIAEPYAAGHSFTLCPEDDLRRMTVVSEDAELKLYDGRMNHNNGWFALSSELPVKRTKGAIRWVITPDASEDWHSDPVIHVSQVGYHPEEPKLAVIELDRGDMVRYDVQLLKITSRGPQCVRTMKPAEWGQFLRYHHLTCDFTDLKEEGLYRLRYGETVSNLFRVAKDVYDRGVWQPVLEYFLPVQMCHMLVREKYRVWHGRCHHDDARMAPLNYLQFDGAAQGASTYCRAKPGQHVTGLNAGGWHDAGDFDLRIESQTGEMYILAAAYEEFGVYLDETTIDQKRQMVEIHQPDGHNDILQQIQHGALSVIGGYRSLGRLYHEVMCGELRQYVLVGDPVNMTSGKPGGDDERLVFTEDNPTRELNAAAHLAGAYRSLKDLDPAQAAECLDIARELYRVTPDNQEERPAVEYDPAAMGKDYTADARIHAACELLISTGDALYRDQLLKRRDYILENVARVGWMVCRAIGMIGDEAFTGELKKALTAYAAELKKAAAETPYGVPYRPNIWGAGWAIQAQGMKYYFLHKAFPDIFSAEPICRALHFILGCHPGANTESFASGVGSESITIGYGLNRADWSYIPGGVSSGTSLIRPDFPELLKFPFLWQQKEYVIGGGSSHYLFLVLAVKECMKRK